MALKSLILCLLLSLLFSDLVCALWLSLGSRAIMDHSRICRKRGRRLAKDPQSIICRKQPEVFKLIVEGSQLAMKECQHQFANHHWNCSDNRRSLKRILTRDTPETAFLNAIVSAGVTHDITAACSRGDLVQCSCGGVSHTALSTERRRSRPNNGQRYKNKFSERRQSDRLGDQLSRQAERREPRLPGRSRRRREEMSVELQRLQNSLRPGRLLQARSHLGHDLASGRVMLGGAEMLPVDAGVVASPGGKEWDWSGCDDNVGFGYRVARDFMDWRYLRGQDSRDIRSIVMLWNNEAGRRAVKNHLVPHCKCHGLSGSCTHRTCWRRLPPFRSVGRHLKDRFNAAIKVIPSNDGETVIPDTESVRSPRKQDLVFLENSPSFCSANKRTGSLGTRGRVCNATSYDLSGCEVMCCGRGYVQEEHYVEENCRCRFTYCCKVTCQKCRRKKLTSRCR
ncbi:protein Wnt-6 [Procambarus clarkii]|uniref:protein Wnt-6 n=1 Tax=Procambarus clarkii TaxID=6728 RepID=UPI003743A48F